MKGSVVLSQPIDFHNIRRSKGLRERPTFIPRPARKALQEWLNLGDELGIDNDKEQALFVRLRGEMGKKLSVRVMQDMVSDAARHAGIEESIVTPHVLRHTCTFMLRTAGADIEMRAKMLGYSVKTALKYSAWKQRD